MLLQCHACGKKFRSMSAEAKHRHNFPAMCTRNRTFERFTAQYDIDTLKERVNTLQYHLGEVISAYDEWAYCPETSPKHRLAGAVGEARPFTPKG